MNYSYKELYSTVIEAYGKSYKDMLIGFANESFDFEAFSNSPLGEKAVFNHQLAFRYNDEMHPDVIEYWKNYKKGLLKEAHAAKNNAPRWLSYMPLSALSEKDRKYPLLIMIHNEDPGMAFLAEGWGFVHLAAEEEFIIVTPDQNSDDHILALYDIAVQEYPVDLSRIYMYGFSMSGFKTARFSIDHPELLAAVALNSHFYPFFWEMPSKERQRKTSVIGLPVIKAVGVSDFGKPVPMNKGQYCLTRNGTDHIRSAQHEVDVANMWLTMNHCEPVSLKSARAIDDPANSRLFEKKMGLPFTRGLASNRDGVVVYIGDIKDKEDHFPFRVAAAENISHWPHDILARISWEFLTCFARDPDTQKSVILRELPL